MADFPQQSFLFSTGGSTDRHWFFAILFLKSLCLSCLACSERSRFIYSKGLLTGLVLCFFCHSLFGSLYFSRVRWLRLLTPLCATHPMALTLTGLYVLSSSAYSCARQGLPLTLPQLLWKQWSFACRGVVDSFVVLLCSIIHGFSLVQRTETGSLKIPEALISAIWAHRVDVKETYNQSLVLQSRADTSIFRKSGSIRQVLWRTLRSRLHWLKIDHDYACRLSSYKQIQ